MSTEGFGLEITELRLGLPGGGDGSDSGGEKKDKKRVFLDILGGEGEVDHFSGDRGGKSRNSESVVGWPPVCSYRKRTILIKMYVKVSMDGAPFLRKIDINGFKGYSEFVRALENLFGVGEECEYVPIYEDKEGDWMLVGDVPWEMFTETCKRLRMKKSVLDCGLQTKSR